MDFLGMADPGVVPADAMTALVYGIIRILAYGAMGTVLVGILGTCWCCLLEHRKGRRCQGWGDRLGRHRA